MDQDDNVVSHATDAGSARGHPAKRRRMPQYGGGGPQFGSRPHPTWARQAMIVDHFVKEVLVRRWTPRNGSYVLDLFSTPHSLGRLARLGQKERMLRRQRGEPTHGPDSGISKLMVFTREESEAPAAAHRAKSRTEAEWEVTYAWGSTLSEVPAGPFDAIVTSSSDLGHIAYAGREDWKRALRKLRERLMPGGIVVARVIDTAQVWRRTRTMSKPAAPVYRSQPPHPGAAPLFTVKLELAEFGPRNRAPGGAPTPLRAMLQLDVPSVPDLNSTAREAVPLSEICAAAERAGYRVLDTRNYEELLELHWNSQEFGDLFQSMMVGVLGPEQRTIHQSQRDLFSLYAALVLQRLGPDGGDAASVVP
eukprot:TRINITY_DN6275_c0_g4_i3.p1 TRINITY_DN6275_c0_g4~~TRINITY_DN6275_c0_g4_i3.p1  ORF type:complete len:363 (+),score=12.63 TRINITY_DN6275_c0_g4_i3:118-1206(+)